jgi:hypothetical protein
MTKLTLSKIEQAQIRLEKAKLAFQREKSKARQRDFKERTTALVTIGGCFEHLMKVNPQAADKIWTQYLSTAAPVDFLKQGRVSALKNVLGIDVGSKEGASPSAKASPQSDLQDRAQG